MDMKVLLAMWRAQRDRREVKELKERGAKGSVDTLRSGLRTGDS